ncbi:MAG: thioredoxin [Salinibacterium sp.]|nr:MAG: thioredoxin [Salinibacterium sp.]
MENWDRALRFTECICAGCIFVGCAILDDESLSLPLVFSGAITLTLSRVTSKGAMNENETTNAVPPGQAGHTGTVEASAGGGPAEGTTAQEALGAAGVTIITSEEQLRSALTKAPGKVLLDFVAQDCEACEGEKPALQQLASSCPGTMVLSVDVDELPHIADALKADGTPTLYMGEGADFLKDLERGSKALEEDKRVPRPAHVKEVNPEDPKLLRRLRCARKK